MRSAGDYVDAAVGTLQGRLPAQIDRFNASHAIQLPHVAADRYFPGGCGTPIPDLAKFPAIEISNGDGKLMTFDLEVGEADVSFPLMAALWFGEPDYNTLTRMVWGYGACIMGALFIRGLCGPSTIPMDAAWSYKTALDENNDGGAVQGFRGVAFAVINVGTIEDW